MWLLCIAHILGFPFLQIKDKHIKQNHFRVTCIFAYVRHFKEQLEELQ